MRKFLALALLLVSSPAMAGGYTVSSVPSITGTANQITQTGSPGPVTLSLPSTLIAPGTIASGANTITSSSASALTVGLNGATNPALQVDASTASQVAGLSVTGAATGGTVALAAIDSGSNANITINAKGSGTIGIGSVSTGAVTITPALRATNLALGGATIGTDALGVTGTTTLGGAVVNSGAFTNTSGGVRVGSGTSNYGFSAATTSLSMRNDFALTWVNGANVNGGTADTFITHPAAATIQFGNADVDTAPVAQTLRVQGPLVGGTSNVAGVNWTFIGSLGKGSSNSGDMIFQTGGAVGASGTTIATATTALTIKGVTGLLRNPTITSDAALTDTGVCQDTTNHEYHSGSAALGACLGTSSRDSKIGDSIVPIAANLLRSDDVPILQWRYKTDPKTLHYGPIADDVCAAYPSLCARNPKGKVISYDWPSYIFLLLEKDRRDIAVLDTENDTAPAFDALVAHNVDVDRQIADLSGRVAALERPPIVAANDNAILLVAGSVK